MAAQALTAHLFSRVQSDLSFLHSQQLLPSTDYELLTSRLQAAQHSAELSAGVAGMSVGPGVQGAGGGGRGGQEGARGVPPPPPQRNEHKKQCRAVWDYTKNQPDDLGFKTGDVITIEEEVNADWWKGSLNGQTGLFPSNHVERIASTASSAPPPPPPVPQQAPAGAYTPVYGTPPPAHSWTSPPPPGSAAAPYAYAQPQQGYGGPSYGEKQPPYGAPLPPPPQQHYGGYQPPPPAAPVQQPPQPQYVVPEEKKSKFGKFGKQMGTAVATGAGFGVGSSLASEAVHAIF